MSSTFPSENRTVTTPPEQLIVVGDALGDWAGPLVVVVDFFAVVVVVDDLLVLFDFGLAVVAVVALVDVGGGSGATGAVLTVVGGLAATAAVGSTRVPAVAPGRGSELDGDAAGDDVAPAGGRAGEASIGGDGGGTAVSGEDLKGSAISSSGAAGTDRAAWRARTTSGCESGETRLVEKRDETSCTPKSPRSTPLAVPRAHVTTRTRRILGPMVGSPTTWGREDEVKSTSRRRFAAHRPEQGRIGGR